MTVIDSRRNYVVRCEFDQASADTDGVVSLSLGWIAEMYTDFGYAGMFPAIFLVGVLFGQVYRRFLRWRASRGLLGTAMVTAVLAGAGALENSFTKTFGGITAMVLIAWAVVNFAVPRWARWH